MNRGTYFLIIFLILTGYLSGQLDARLYFLHVPKTGGTTMRLLLELQLDAAEIYPYRNINTAKGMIEEELVSGHFPFWFCKTRDRDFKNAFKVTILRDPVERYLSFLRAKKKADKTLPDFESVLKIEGSPWKKYQDDLVDNALCRYLASRPDLENESLLKSAKQTLNSLDCVILFEQFSQDVIQLFERLGIVLEEKDIPKINVTEKEPVNPQLLEEVRKLNELDIQLYEYAKKHLQKKTTRYTLRKASFEPILKESNLIDYTFNLPLLGRGWTYREIIEPSVDDFPMFRWVMDKPADIYFNLEKGNDYHFYFNAQCLTQEVEPKVRVNGLEIELVQLNKDLFSLYHGVIPKECLTDELTMISFYSEKSFYFRDIYPKIYNRNHPKLSFAVNHIEISKLDEN